MCVAFHLRAARARAVLLGCLAVASVVFPASAVHAADVIKGQRIYAMHCAVCHGANGMSVMPTAPNFARGERLMQPDPMLLGSVRMGRNAMPGFLGVLNDRDILDVVAFLRTLR